MLSPVPLGDLPSVDFIPQAIFGRPVSYFVKTMNIPFADNQDDFDHYQGAAFILNERVPFALKHYNGHPPDTITVYLPSDLQEIGLITETILMLMRELKLGKDVLVWQRTDNPDL